MEIDHRLPSTPLPTDKAGMLSDIISQWQNPTTEIDKLTVPDIYITGSKSSDIPIVM